MRKCDLNQDLMREIKELEGEWEEMKDRSVSLLREEKECGERDERELEPRS